MINENETLTRRFANSPATPQRIQMTMQKLGMTRYEAVSLLENLPQREVIQTLETIPNKLVEEI